MELSAELVESEVKPAKPRRVRKPRVPKAAAGPVADDSTEAARGAAAAPPRARRAKKVVAREEQPTPDEPTPDEPAAPAAMIEADPEPALAAAPNGADHALRCAGRCRRPRGGHGSRSRTIPTSRSGRAGGAAGSADASGRQPAAGVQAPAAASCGTFSPGFGACVALNQAHSLLQASATSASAPANDIRTK